MNELLRVCRYCPRSAVCVVEGAWQSQIDNEQTHFGFRRIICHPWYKGDVGIGVGQRTVFYISPEKHEAAL